jgi:hypothetical protein
MIPKPTQKEKHSAGLRPMLSRLIRFTPKCGYAEVEVVEHTGSWHKPGDVILLDPDEYARGRTVKPAVKDDDLYKHRSTPIFAEVDTPEPEYQPRKPGLAASRESIEKFLSNLPTTRKSNANPRRKSKK